MTPPQAEAAATTASTPRPVAVVFPTRTGGVPHVVTVLSTDDGALSCTCKAFLSIHLRPQGCWAMKEVRRMLALPTPAVVVESEVNAESGATNSPVSGHEEGAF